MPASILGASSGHGADVALDDPEKARLLLETAADANARSDDGRTALIVAVGRNSILAAPTLDHR